MSHSLRYLLQTLNDDNRDQTIAILKGVGFTSREVREMIPSEKLETTCYPPQHRLSTCQYWRKSLPA
jgi:hypothetical protein